MSVGPPRAACRPSECGGLLTGALRDRGTNPGAWARSDPARRFMSRNNPPSIVVRQVLHGVHRRRKLGARHMRVRGASRQTVMSGLGRLGALEGQPRHCLACVGELQRDGAGISRAVSRASPGHPRGISRASGDSAAHRRRRSARRWESRDTEQPPRRVQWGSGDRHWRDLG